MKLGPLLAMAGVFLLGLWIVLGPVQRFYGIETRPGAQTRRVLVAGFRGVVETAPDPATGEPTFRVLYRDGWASPVLSGDEFTRVFGPGAYDACVGGREFWLFRVLNITTWAGLAWVALGLGGQAAFAGRMILQWFVSERRRESVVPEYFWWLSLAGGAALFAYFGWRQDIVGVLGQSTGVVIYARNLRLISKQRQRSERAGRGGGEAQPTAGAGG